MTATYVDFENGSGNSAETTATALIIADDHGNGPATATPVSVGSSISGDIEVVGDVDWFSFRAEEGRSYRFDTPLFTLYDSWVTVYDQDGQIVLASGGGYGSALAWSAPTGGTYYVNVSGYFEIDTGTYELIIDESTDDHGNGAATATPVSVGSSISGDIEVSGDVDWFSFHAEAGTSYRFDTTLFTLYDSWVTIYDQDGQTALASGGGYGSALAWSAPTSGTYYVNVSGYFEIDTGTYELIIDGTDDHGNSAATATPVSVGSSISGDIEVPGDVDWFSFQVEAGRLYEFETTLGALPDSVITLYDQNGTFVSFDDDGGTSYASLLSWRAPVAGTYHLEVSGYGPDEGSYDLAIRSFVEGDANRDGKVDASDLNILALNWYSSSANSWQNGDFDDSGTVNVRDLNAMALNWLDGVEPPDESRSASGSRYSESVKVVSPANHNRIADADTHKLISQPVDPWADYQQDNDWWLPTGSLTNFRKS